MDLTIEGSLNKPDFSDQNVDAVKQSLKQGAIVDSLIKGTKESDEVGVLSSSRVPSLGLGVDEAIQECLDGDSENSKDGQENCELDVTGLDDRELDSVSVPYF